MTQLPPPLQPGDSPAPPTTQYEPQPTHTDRRGSSLLGVVAIVVSWLMVWAVVAGTLRVTYHANQTPPKAASSTQPTTAVILDDDEDDEDPDVVLPPVVGPSTRPHTTPATINKPVQPPSTAPAVPVPPTDSQASKGKSDKNDDEDRSPSVATRMMQKYMLGVSKLAVGNSGNEAVKGLRESAQSPEDQLAVAVFVGEMNNADAALKEIDQLNRKGKLGGLETEVRLLRQIYRHGSPSLSQHERDWIRYRLGFAGELAAVHGINDTDTERARVLNAGKAMVAVVFGVVSAAVIGMLVGIVLLVVAITMLVRRRLKVRYGDLVIQSSSPAKPEDQSAAPAAGQALPLPWTAYGSPIPPPIPPPMPVAVVPPYPGSPYPVPPYSGPQYAGAPYPAPPMMWMPPPPIPLETYRLGRIGDQSPRTGPFIEAFAIYLVGYLGVALVGHRLGLDRWGFGWQMVAGLVPILFALLWPKLRGCSWKQWRIGYGFVLPRGIFRELGSGILAYLAGLPLLAIAIVIALMLSKASGTTPRHPINETSTDGVGPLVLFLVAAVWAPITEEAFFRGGLFHRLRRGWGWVISAIVSSFIFAAVHPQGWTMIPALGMMGFILCAMREWRGSTIPGMAAHALHNGTLVLVLIVASM